MNIRSWAAVSGGILAFSTVSPAFGFFEGLSKLSEEIQAIEQSSPEGLNDLLQKLEQNGGKQFTDVHNADWFYRYVSSVARWGIVSGYSNATGTSTGSFGPGNQVTVGEILKMSLRAAQVNENDCTGSPGYTQAETHWARPFVICGQQMKLRLLQSKPDLNRPALRGEVLSVVFDAFADGVPPLLSSFTDTVNHPLESDIAYGAALKIVSGDKDAGGNATGTFRPNDPVNRAEAAKIIYQRLRVEVMGEN